MAQASNRCPSRPDKTAHNHYDSELHQLEDTRSFDLEKSKETSNLSRHSEETNEQNATNVRAQRDYLPRSKLLPSILSLVMCTTLAIQMAGQTHGGRLVRLCIASVDLVKLSSQCVMCNRREFPLTVNDCTGITKMNDLIANPLSVQDATCLIYNCRRQVPDVRPEPYHGSVSAVRTNYPSTSGSRSYEMMASPGMYGSYSEAPPVSRWNSYGSSHTHGSDPFSSPSSNMISGRQQALPYALVPAPYSSPFGLRKYRAALIPLFR